MSLQARALEAYREFRRGVEVHERQEAEEFKARVAKALQARFQVLPGEVEWEDLAPHRCTFLVDGLRISATDPLEREEFVFDVRDLAPDERIKTVGDIKRVIVENCEKLAFPEDL